ncbi:hypothetical protein H0H92_013695, partial [Tricholoma furcatifolium]
TTTSDGAATDSRPNADEVTDPQATTRPDLTPFLPLNELSTFQTRGAYDRTISRPADATTSGRASHSTINSFVKVSMLPRGAYPAPAPAEDERVFHVFIPDDPNPQTLTKSQLAANLLCNLAGIKLQIDGEKYEILAEVFRAKRLRDHAIVIIKESWILESRKNTEADFIKGATVTQIPTIIVSETYPGLSTLTLRKIDNGREKRRVIESPVCVPLTEVRGCRELLGLYLDFTF